MSAIPGAADRLSAVREAAGLRYEAPPRRIDSDSNDAWLVADQRWGEVIVRVSWRGDISRLEREIAVATRLPATVRYPDVVGHGHTDAQGHPLAYTLTRRLRGRQLNRCWEELTPAQRRTAIAELGRMLRELHAWTPPHEVASLVCRRPDLRLGTIAGVVGSDVTPLPLERTLLLTSYAARLPYVDSALIADAEKAMGDLRSADPAMDDPARHGLIHGDLHLSNLWWSGPDRLFLLDLEWVRFGPPALDLQRLCDSADEDVLRGNDTHPSVLRWLAADYPELFGGPDLLARLRLYSLTFAIRQIIVYPPDRPAGQLPPDHALRQLRRLIDGGWPAPGALPENVVRQQYPA